MFNLKPPHGIFVHASGFLKLASTLSCQPTHPTFDPLCSAAIVANIAFAIELYLKCLIQLETGQLIKNEHDLHKLFAKLNEETQQEIETQFNSLQKNPQYDLSNAPEEIKKAAASAPKNLREALKVGGNAFVEWRYLYESTGYGNHFSLFPLPTILQTAILKKKPEWGAFQIRAVKVAGVQSTSPAQ